MLALLGQAGCVSVECGVESLTVEGREALAKRCKMTTDQLADRLVEAKRHIPFVQANLIEMPQDEDAVVQSLARQDAGCRHMGQRSRCRCFRIPARPITRGSGARPTICLGARARYYFGLFRRIQRCTGSAAAAFAGTGWSRLMSPPPRQRLLDDDRRCRRGLGLFDAHWRRRSAQRLRGDAGRDGAAAEPSAVAAAARDLRACTSRSPIWRWNGWTRTARTCRGPATCCCESRIGSHPILCISTAFARRCLTGRHRCWWWRIPACPRGGRPAAAIDRSNRAGDRYAAGSGCGPRPCRCAGRRRRRHSATRSSNSIRRQATAERSGTDSMCGSGSDAQAAVRPGGGTALGRSQKPLRPPGRRTGVGLARARRRAAAKSRGRQSMQSGQASTGLVRCHTRPCSRKCSAPKFSSRPPSMSRSD